MGEKCVGSCNLQFVSITLKIKAFHSAHDQKNIPGFKKVVLLSSHVASTREFFKMKL